jgi:hypothetical protein
MHVRKVPLLIGLSVLILAVLACTINIGGPAFPDQRIPVSTQAILELQTAIQAAGDTAAGNGQFSLVITEEQITAYLASHLQPQSEPPFTDPQVYLRNGQIQVFGLAQQGYFQATIEIVITAGVDEQGRLKIELTSADFGPLPVPVGLNDVVSAAIQEAFTGAIGPAAIGLRLESLTVEDGTMTVVGRTK